MQPNTMTDPAASTISGNNQPLRAFILPVHVHLLLSQSLRQYRRPQAHRADRARRWTIARKAYTNYKNS
jgi:hypothetical protein